MNIHQRLQSIKAIRYAFDTIKENAVESGDYRARHQQAILTAISSVTPEVDTLLQEASAATEEDKRQPYSDFHGQISRLISDDRIGPTAKLIMVVYFVRSSQMEGMPGDMTIAHLCNLPMSDLKEAQRELMVNDWLASPEG
jgi:hypothetical protein